MPTRRGLSQIVGHGANSNDSAKATLERLHSDRMQCGAEFGMLVAPGEFEWQRNQHHQPPRVCGGP
eukprot:10268398-Lingulodinium_polyedra.AAC.1